MRRVPTLRHGVREVADSTGSAAPSSTAGSPGLLDLAWRSRRHSSQPGWSDLTQVLDHLAVPSPSTVGLRHTSAARVSEQPIARLTQRKWFDGRVNAGGTQPNKGGRLRRAGACLHSST
jgi:hypothetical protein